ncbi:hypothetical protein F511_38376 [Dorcoceras hygrometricum]|uniref:Uncharacterized protein n=1 Tax=Dorcoceras hygrometricum TaxID=472368 RepID=A0A2Z7C6V7_9LAMI|nr:hypothetical protein F511_38376 [Dorcoceras hygrometricum]
MDDFRSNSHKDPRMQLDNTHNYHLSGSNHDGVVSSNPNGMQDLRCYSASYATSSAQPDGQMDIVVPTAGDPWKFKKGKSTNGLSSKSWNFNDPELQRKKRVASYKAYTVEGKVKGSIKKSFRWLKERCNLMLYGHR